MARLIIVVVSLFIGSCAASLNGNEAREPNKRIPSSFGGERSTTGTYLTTASLAQKKWNEFFTSPDLRKLIETARKNNQELNIRIQEIIIAQSEVLSRQGEYLPTINAEAGAGVEKVGKYTSQGAGDEDLRLPKNLGDFRFGLAGSWELDIWGKLRNSKKAADLLFLSSIEGQKFTMTQIVAEVARSYFELIALDNQLDIMKRNIELQTNALEVIRLEKLAARVTELAVQRFEAEVLKNKSRLYQLEQDRVQAENRINFLVGRYPQPVRRNMKELESPIPDFIRSTLPSQLLNNRPDVRQAELELSAAKLDVSAAKAAFYPSLSIEAGVGYRSFSAKHLVQTPESLVYNVAGNLIAPLINRNAITAQYRSANARQLQAVYNYERTLLQAFTDVVNQLAMISNLHKSYDLQSQQVEKLSQSMELSTLLFRSARADYMEVLLTRRDYLDAQMELVEKRKLQLQAMVGIYQALGGGWQAGSQQISRP